MSVVRVKGLGPFQVSAIIKLIVVLGLAYCQAACFGARSVKRNYYVLHAPKDGKPSPTSIRGLIRVRDLAAESVYEKFQIVIRHNPFQLRYSGAHAWAVRPNVMIADIIGRVLLEKSVFTGVTRDLSDARPQYTLAGELSALEVYESQDHWQVHLALSVGVYRFHDGERVWRFTFDKHKPIAVAEMSHAVQGMSELLQQALHEAVMDLARTVDDPEVVSALIVNPGEVLTRSEVMPDRGRDTKSSVTQNPLEMHKLGPAETGARRGVNTFVPTGLTDKK